MGKSAAKVKVYVVFLAYGDQVDSIWSTQEKADKRLAEVTPLALQNSAFMSEFDVDEVTK